MKAKISVLPASILLFSLMYLPMKEANSNSKFTSTLEGGVTVSYVTAPQNLTSALKITPNVSQDFSGYGLAFRIKNNILDGGGSPMFLYINETDSDRVAAKPGESYYLYSLDGAENQVAFRDGDNAIVLPASFDGYIYVPYSGMQILDGYGNGNKTMNYSSIYAIYLEVNTYYDAFSNFSIGGVEILKDGKSQMVLDPSKLNDLTYANYYSKDYNGEYINISHKSVGSGEVSSDIDFDKLSLSKNLDKGLQLSYKGAESDISAQWAIAPSVRTLGTNANALSIRIKNQVSITTPITMALKNRRNVLFYVNKETGKNIFFKSLDGSLSINSWRDWDSAITIPANFDGWMILPIQLFKTGESVDPTDVKQIVFSTSIFKNYDAFTSLTFGDLQIIEKDNKVSSYIDMKSLDDEQFNQTFVKLLNEDYINFVRYEKSSLLAYRKGDVKYLERIDHVKDDTELNSEFPVWSGGSKLTNTLVETYGGNKGIQVDIGEVIANNNIYGSFDVFPKYYTEDWTNWSDGGETKDQDAKGVTCYLKNLSRKEITINLEFEEMTKKNNQNIAERWNVQLGAMIMYYDINTKQEFIRVAKPSIVIPVGFEGYIRIDFSQYSVPSWCTIGDMQLDLSATMSGFFVTTDCSNNEGLSFVISDFGVYFNNTSISTLFEESNISIRNNMEDNL